MANSSMLTYLPRGSFIHKLTGTTKLCFFVMVSVAAMVTFDTRLLAVLLVGTLVLFKCSRLHFRDVKWVLWLAFIFLVLNHLFIYLFSPEYGVELYGSRTVLFTLTQRYTVTSEQLFYHLNMLLKVCTVIPLALIFILCTDPSEFAASLASVGISYRIGYSVSLALRYIPDIQRDYHDINQAQQARGVDISGKDKFFDRLRGSVNILMPLILSSLSRIDTISNAMELRGFGKNPKRTWYVQRPFKKADWAALCAAVLVLLVTLAVTVHNGGRFWNPFV